MQTLQKSRARPTWQLPNNAGGVVTFNLTSDQRAFEARVWSSPVLRLEAGIVTPAEGAVQLALEVDAVNVNKPVARLLLLSKNDIRVLESTKGEPAATAAQLPPTRTYWLSFDRWNRCIRYGQGYHMIETLEQEWDLGKLLKGQPELNELFGPGLKLVSLEITKRVGSHLPGQGIGDDMNVAHAAAVVECDPLPLVANPPPLVKDSSLVTLDDLAENPRKSTFSADLPSACQVLYNNIKGLKLEAGSASSLRPGLAEAIKYSIETPGKELYKKLWHKKYPKETEYDSSKPIDKGPGEFPYLRVTLGAAGGDGPGIPYVLEIWPGLIGRSPVHNHGNVCAVIKVLYGGINVKIFNKMELNLEAGKDPGRVDQAGTVTQAALFETYFGEEQVTWMSPHWYQCHQLDNTYRDKKPTKLGDFCATIQCYKYDDFDPVRWTGFDYIQSTGGHTDIHLFVPDSDYDFATLKKLVMEEYTSAEEAIMQQLTSSATASGSRRKTVAVIGDGNLDAEASAVHKPECVTGDEQRKLQLAEEVGRCLVDAGYRVQTGGLGGVMEAALKGAKSSPSYQPGDTIAILPGSDPSSANAYADIIIPTGLGEYRNGIVARADAVVAVGGGAGTLQELAIAWGNQRPVVVVERVSGVTAELVGKHIDSRGGPDRPAVMGVSSGTEAVSCLQQLGL